VQQPESNSARKTIAEMERNRLAEGLRENHGCALMDEKGAAEMPE
jgi:hypothetical protein